MDRLRVLITNCRLHGRSGTEMYVYDLARSLIRLGHLPIVYSPILGPLAEQLSGEAIPVVQTLDGISDAPDVVHGHHTLETLTAMLFFPRTPGLFVCHGCNSWNDRPPVMPRLRHYIGVDEPCADRLALHNGIGRERISVLTNAVDLERFQPRSALPPRPRRAIVYSSYATPQGLRPIEAACRATGMSLDVIGTKIGNPCDRPQDLLPHYDLVFAKGRCAREAMAVGCAVVYCDVFGLGQLVTRSAVERLNTLGRRVMHERMTTNRLIEEINRYDAADAAAVSAYIRTANSPDTIHARLIDVYRKVIVEQQSASDRPEDDLRAVAELTRWWAEEWKDLVRQQARRNRPWAVARRWWQSATNRLGRHRFNRPHPTGATESRRAA